MITMATVKQAERMWLAYTEERHCYHCGLRGAHSSYLDDDGETKFNCDNCGQDNR
jgi:transcription initiation factor IIE alpha subunit